ncbi:MAG: hydrocarbon-binding protein [Myxococcota bacterium]
MSVALQPERLADRRPQPLRPTLGDFNSIVCFRAAVAGIEETLGAHAALIALSAAGRIRGRELVASLHLSTGVDLQAAARAMQAALGAEGTRLCVLESIEECGDKIRVTVSETVCMAGEAPGSERRCSFTLGAVHGALEALTGRLLKGRHTESPVAGDPADVFEFEDRI